MQLNIKKQATLLNDKRFIPLGKTAGDPVSLREIDLTKILAEYKRSREKEVWGTLGWEDDKPFTPAGDIVFSETGNLNEGMGNGVLNPLTLNEINDLKAVNPELRFDRKEVRERFINFDEVEFRLPDVFNPVDLPRLRLTLFLEPDEGALVYCQHSKKGDFWDQNAVSEYILYDKMQSPDRDRLTYYFPVEPKHVLEEVDESLNLYRETTEETGLSFIVKILTFKQQKGTEKQIYERFLKSINLNPQSKKQGEILYEMVGKDKYQLLKFNPVAQGKPLGAFEPVTVQGKVSNTAKTLLLIHGTFVDTETSYESLLVQRPGGTCYLQDLIASGKFEQILALNHPTISHNAEQNVTWLANRMKELNISLEKPLQVITTSRGALVAEFMASYEAIRKYIPLISKVMMFSAGNGCGYFQLGDKISRVLGIWKAISPGPAGKVISGLAQLSVEWLLSQPGCVLMNENHPELNRILSREPLNRNIRYKSVVSDWHKCLITEEGWMKRMGKTSLDAVIRIALGKQHDWVIGLEQQKRIPVSSGASDISQRHAVHGRYLELGYARDENCIVISDPHAIIHEYFD